LSSFSYVSPWKDARYASTGREPMSTDYPPGEMPPRNSKYHRAPPSPYCPHFIEKLLLPIIDAHPLPADQSPAKASEHSRQVRLSRALGALLGVERPTGRKSDYDLPLLMRIARERLWDQDYLELQQATYDDESVYISPKTKLGALKDVK